MTPTCTLTTPATGTRLDGPGPARPDPWSSLVERFATYQREQGRHPGTVAAYRVHLRALGQAHPYGPASVDEPALEAWVRGRGGSARNAHYAARAFYQWAVALDLVRSSPVGVWRGRTASSPYGYVKTMPRAWRTATDEHLDRLHAQGLRERSIAVHLTYLVRFANVHHNPWVVEPGDIARWLAGHRWAPETQRSALKALRLFYRHAKQSGRTKIAPTDLLDRPRVPRALPRPASEDVILRALRDADVRTRLMLLLAAMAGLRSGEIAAVHLGDDLDLDDVGGTLLVHGKGGHERRVPVHPVLAAELREERLRRTLGVTASGFDPRGHLDVDGWLFPNRSGTHMTSANVSRVVSKALPAGVTAHMLRHRFATQSYRVGKNIRAVQELLGHANISTTERYTMVANDDLRTAVLAVPQLAYAAAPWTTT